MYPIGTIFVHKERGTAWQMISEDTVVVVRTTDKSGRFVGEREEFRWERVVLSLWNVELPKEDLFAKLYLTLKK